jgi:hypothetical protein
MVLSALTILAEQHGQPGDKCKENQKLDVERGVHAKYPGLVGRY